jgi:ligand-binding sensor domain-containing protein/serine phosphatase RsbU (regulator of sigma subunit)
LKRECWSEDGRRETEERRIVAVAAAVVVAAAGGRGRQFNFENRIMRTNIFVLVLLTFIVFACKQKREQTQQNTFAPKVVEAHGYVFPADSLRKPKVILVDESKLGKRPAGKPMVIPTNTNIHLAGKPTILNTGTPRVCTPGKDTFLLPKVIPVIDSPFLAGIPEVILVKEAFVKDQNSQNFSSYGKLQGLKHQKIHCIIQDKCGNLWFGTAGGVTKYDGKFFTHFTVKEGLSSNSVISMIQDKNDNLWFGTYGGGAIKYDGKYFTIYTEKDGLCSNNIWAILQDKSGNIWFCSESGGISKLALSGAEGSNQYTFTNFNTKEGLCYGLVLSVMQDKSGNIWFGADRANVSKYDGKSFTNFLVKEGKNISKSGVWSMMQDKSGNIWFGTQEGGVTMLSSDGRSMTNFTEKEGLLSNTVNSIIQDKSGNIWFGTENGISIYDGTYFTDLTEKEGLCNNIVQSVFQDKSGNIWIGTINGINKYEGRVFAHYTNKGGLSNNYVSSVYQDKSSNLWFGTNGGGLNKYDGKCFSHFTGKEGLMDCRITSIVKDLNDNIWFGTAGGGVIKYDGKFLTQYLQNDGLCYSIVHSAYMDKSGDLWFGTDGGGISRFSRDGKYITNYYLGTSINSNIVRSIAQDNSGNLWFGTQEGLFKYDPSASQKTGIYSLTQFTEKEGLSNNYVTSILQDHSGNLWFGTLGGGVNKYDGKCFTHYTEKEGLLNNNISGIIQDHSGNLWFGSRFGLSKMQTKNPELSLFKNYTYEDGFFGIGCNNNAIFEDNNGTIWIGANDRLTAYHPEGDDPDTLPPNIQITEISLFNENIPWINLQGLDGQVGSDLADLIQAKDTTFILKNGVKVGNFKFDGITKWYGLPENLSLAYNNNYLSFNFVGITTKSPQKVKYKYILEGLENNWSALTSRNEANYGNLPHGTYTFKVKAMNSEGYWSKEFNYRFTIQPPWWKTWWFKTIYISAFIISLILFYRWRTASLRKRQKELETKVLIATAEIRQQNEEITAQRDEISVQRELVIEKNEELNQQNEEITTQRDEIEAQKNIIENKNKNITDSIRYAQRIQQAILPMDEKLDALLADHFVFYQPKDIVSGDFYWAENFINSNNESITLFSAIDCTGHGVPGAFMSLMGYNGLSQAVKENGLSKPGEILNFLSDYIRKMLRQRKEESNVKDGMDLFLCSLNRNTMILEYAGVHNSAYLMRKGELIILQPDNHPIAEPFSDEFSSYNNKVIELKKGDTLYLFTDGYLDQFGGKDRKKFMSKRFREILVEIQSLNMAEQKKRLSEVFEAWKGSNEQYDDVLVMGMRVG